MFFGDLPTSSSSNTTTSKSNLLSDLPSSGNLLEVEDSTTSGEFSKYLCLHNTAPEQEIKTDTTTMLIRSFSLKKRNRKKKSSSSAKRGKKRKKASSSSSSDSSIRFDGGKRKKQSKTTSASSNDKKASRNRRLELACLRESLQRQGLDTVGTESELRLRLRQHHEESTEQQRVRLTAEPTTTNNASEREYWDIEF